MYMMYRRRANHGDNFGRPTMVRANRGDRPNVVIYKNVAQFLLSNLMTKTDIWVDKQHKDTHLKAIPSSALPISSCIG